MRQPIPTPFHSSAQWRDSLGSALRAEIRSLARCDAAVGREKAFALWLDSERIAALRVATRDELSDYMSSPAKDLLSFKQRPDQENVVAAILLEGQPLTLKRLELAAGLAIGAARQTLRTAPHFSVPDAKGRRVEFVAPALLSAEVHRICAIWNEDACDEAAIERFLWLLVAVSNIHAFRDGNGRLSRAVANAYLIKSGLLPHGPLPLGPLIYATQGNYELALRRAELTSDWEPLARVMLSLIKSYAEHYSAFAACRVEP